MARIEGHTVIGIPRRASLNGYDADAAGDATAVYCDPVTIVQQHFAEEVDINTIVRRFGATGQVPLGASGTAVYGDFTGITDYDSARETMARADAMFMALPADVRLKFDNNPGKLIEMAQSMEPAEFEGLFVEPVPPAPVAPAPVAPAPAPVAPEGGSS